MWRRQKRQILHWLAPSAGKDAGDLQMGMEKRKKTGVKKPGSE
jgi:hypothetical protein